VSLFWGGRACPYPFWHTHLTLLAPPSCLLLSIKRKTERVSHIVDCIGLSMVCFLLIDLPCPLTKLNGLQVDKLAIGGQSSMFLITARTPHKNKLTYPHPYSLELSQHLPKSQVQSTIRHLLALKPALKVQPPYQAIEFSASKGKASTFHFLFMC
jgi:hypothetical protein